MIIILVIYFFNFWEKVINCFKSEIITIITEHDLSIKHIFRKMPIEHLHNLNHKYFTKKVGTCSYPIVCESGRNVGVIYLFLMA